MKNQSSAVTHSTLTNGAALVVAVFQKFAPDAATREMVGSALTAETICNIAQTIFEQKLKSIANLPAAHKG